MEAASKSIVEGQKASSAAKSKETKLRRALGGLQWRQRQQAGQCQHGKRQSAQTGSGEGPPAGISLFHGAHRIRP
jgi:hypothetical protein